MIARNRIEARMPPCSYSRRNETINQNFLEQEGHFGYYNEQIRKEMEIERNKIVNESKTNLTSIQRKILSH